MTPSNPQVVCQRRTLRHLVRRALQHHQAFSQHQRVVGMGQWGEDGGRAFAFMALVLGNLGLLCVVWFEAPKV